MIRAAAVLVALAVVSACGESGRSAERYCGQIQVHLDTLNDPQIDDGADITRTIAIYRRIAAAAPAAVEPEWAQLVASLETASTVDPDDPDSLQRVADTARSTRPAATRVQQYTDRTCALRIEDPPPPTNPVTATTTPSDGTSDDSPATGDGG